MKRTIIFIVFALLSCVSVSSQTPTFSFSADKIQETFFGCTFGEDLKSVQEKLNGEYDEQKKTLSIYNRHFGSQDWNTITFAFDNSKKFCLITLFKSSIDKSEISLAYQSVSGALSLKYGNKSRFLNYSSDKGCCYLNANMDGKGVLLINLDIMLALAYGDINGFMDLAGIHDF